MITKAQEIEQLAINILANGDMESLVFYLTKLDEYHARLICSCLNAKSGTLTCEACDESN